MSDIYNKIEEYVNASFAEKNFSHTPSHLKDTANCVLLLKPDADLGLRIAALCHDIDRAFKDRSNKVDGFNGPIFLKDHQENSANITANYLRSIKAPDILINRVWHLISKHEEGGDADQNILKDADSLSFFRSKCYVEIINKYDGAIWIVDKIDWMYDRITSPVAKDLAKPMYEEALEILDKESHL